MWAYIRDTGKAFGLLVIVSALFGLLAVGPAQAAGMTGAAKTWPDGTLVYSVKLNGAEVGRETASFEEELTRVTIRSRAEFTKPTAATITTDLMVTQGALAFEKYVLSATVGGALQQLTVIPAPDGLSYRVEAGGRAQEGKLKVAPGFLILDNNVTAHYNVLIRRYLLAKETEWTMVVPQVMMALPIKITGSAGEKLNLGGREREAIHISALGPMNMAIDIWADSERQILLKLAIPAQKYEVELLEGTGGGTTSQAGAVPPTPTKPEAVPTPVPTASASEPTGRPGATATAVNDAGLPAGVMAREVSFANGDVLLAGTLTLPEHTTGTRLPAAVLIHGSGPQDRNENSAALSTNIFRDLAHYLSARGVAVLRYDKRGVGQSTGNLAEAKMTDLVSDAKAAVSFIRSLPEVDPDQVVLIGHSEGGVLAPIVAADDPEIAAVVLLAGAARSLDKIITDQVVYLNRQMGTTEEQMQEVLRAQEVFYALAKSGQEWGVVQGQMTYLGWFREHFLHDPLATIVKVKAPILILQGEKDFQVPKGEAIALGEALAQAGHPDYQVVMFPNLDHLFMFTEGESTLQSYLEKQRQIDPTVLKTIGDWLEARGLAEPYEKL